MELAKIQEDARQKAEATRGLVRPPQEACESQAVKRARQALLEAVCADQVHLAVITPEMDNWLTARGLAHMHASTPEDKRTPFLASVGSRAGWTALHHAVEDLTQKIEEDAPRICAASARPSS